MEISPYTVNLINCDNLFKLGFFIKNMKRERTVSFIFIIIAAIILFGLIYLLFQIPEIGITGYATTDFQLGNLTVGVQTYIACTWSSSTLNVSFGTSLDPGSTGVNASQNYIMDGSPNNGTGYNVTVDVLSTAAADMTITGDDLIYSGNVLGIGNVSYASNSTDFNGTNMIYSGSTNITGSPVDIITNEAVGSTAWYRLWIDLPAGVVAGNYVGNYTIQCEEA